MSDFGLTGAIAGVSMSQLEAIRTIAGAERIRREQREQLEKMRGIGYTTCANGPAGIMSGGGAGGVGYADCPGAGAGGVGYLEAVPEGVDQASAFVARQLVAQAQSDYRQAVDRATQAERDAARMRTELERANTFASGQAAELEQFRRLSQPRIRRELISPLFDRTPGTHELKWPFLALSWACVVAGVVVCVL